MRDPEKLNAPMGPIISTVGHVTKSSGRAVSTPSILKTNNIILVAYDEYSTDRTVEVESEAVIAVSTDDGSSWCEVARFSARHGRLFNVEKAIYYIGHHRDIVIARSDDFGRSWTRTSKLTEGQMWHQTSANVVFCDGRVYLAMERVTGGIGETWQVPWLAPVLMSAATSSDLLARENWAFATELSFCEIIPGYRTNNLAIDFFGVPFFSQEFPHRAYLGNSRVMHPIGWLEANVVRVTDERHYWHDPTSRTFHLLMRGNTGGAGFAAVAKVVQHASGKMSTTLQRAPSGKLQLFIPLPGGHLRFHIVFDEMSGLFWLLSNQATDSMCRIEHIPANRYALPNNERNRLVLHFSKNIVDWCFACVVDIGNSETECRCYASMVVDADDLIIASRSGSPAAVSSRDSDTITFHRIHRFRSLIY